MEVASLAGDLGTERQGTSWKTQSPWIGLKLKGCGRATLGPALYANFGCLNLITAPGKSLKDLNLEGNDKIST